MKFKIILFSLVVASVLPISAKALSLADLLGNFAPGQPRVLGTMTPSPDINGDGIVNSIDVAVLVGHIGQNFPAADLNSDGAVNSIDLSILSSWWFASNK